MQQGVGSEFFLSTQIWLFSWLLSSMNIFKRRPLLHCCTLRGKVASEVVRSTFASTNQALNARSPSRLLLPNHLPSFAASDSVDHRTPRLILTT